MYSVGYDISVCVSMWMCGGDSKYLSTSVSILSLPVMKKQQNQNEFGSHNDPPPPPPLKSKVSLHRCADLWLVREPGKRVFSSLRFCELGKSYAWEKVNLVKNMARDFINLPQSRQGTSSWALLDIRNVDAAKIWQLLPISQGVPRSNTHKAPSDARFKGSFWRPSLIKLTSQKVQAALLSNV